MLGVNGAIEPNVFLSSVNANVNARVNADARCESVLNLTISWYLDFNGELFELYSTCT